MYKRLSDIAQDLNSLRENGFKRGYSIGWDFDDVSYTVKLGSTTYIAAAPASGKTELIKEIQISLSCLHGFNHVIFSPETGNPTEIFAELCHAFIGKPYLKGFNAMDEAERVQAEMFIDEHFIIIDPIDEELTITDFYKLVDTIEIDTGKTIHTTLIDPWNELTEEYKQEDLGREDKYLSRILGESRKNSRKSNRHHFIVTHVRDQKLVTVGGVTYYPPPHAREFAGGQVWFRKGNTMLIPWRPPTGLSGDDNIQYEPNELHLRIAKSKPKGVSKNGTYKMYLDTDRYQYYIKKDGKKVYADRGEYNLDVKEYEPKPLPKNLAFEDTVQVSKQKLEADKEQQRRDAIDKEIEDNGIEFTPTKQTK